MYFCNGEAAKTQHITTLKMYIYIYIFFPLEWKSCRDNYKDSHKLDWPLHILLQSLRQILHFLR